MANSHEPLGVNVKGKQIAFKIRHSEKKVNTMKKLFIYILSFAAIVPATLAIIFIGLNKDYTFADAADTVRYDLQKVVGAISDSPIVRSENIDSLIFWAVILISLTLPIGIVWFLWKISRPQSEAKSTEAVKPPASRLAPRG
jgi:hypothetical protein